MIFTVNITSLNTLNLLVFLMNKDCVVCKVGTEFSQRLGLYVYNLDKHQSSKCQGIKDKDNLPILQSLHARSKLVLQNLIYNIFK
jgi:hypothetical protein